MTAGPPSLNRALRWTAFVAGYLVLAYLLLRPILRTDVIADDFEAPFAQLQMGATNLVKTVSYGWQISSADPARRFGWVAGAVANWLWIWISKTLDISVLDAFSLIRFVCLVACAAAAATLWWLSARSYYRPVRWSTALLLTSVALFGTLQLHGMWSNDPVESYPLAGYAAAALGFGLLVLVVWAAQQPSLLRFALLAIVGVLCVSYYEFNLGATLGGAIILAATAWPHRRQLWALALPVAGALTLLVAPMLWLLANGAQNPGGGYSGRAVQVSGAFHSIVIGLVSSLPGAAWALSNTMLEGHWGLTAAAVVTAVLAVLAAAAWLKWWGRNPVVLAPATGQRSNLMLAAIAAAVAVYAVFAIGLEGATVKVEQQASTIGYVYTAYAVGSTAVALLLAVLVWVVVTHRRRSRRWLAATLVLAACAVALVAVQGSLNSHLQTTLNVNSAQNQTLDSAFAAGVPEGTRCDALRGWVAHIAPLYYRSAVVRGAEVGYRSLYGSLFCPEMVAPADGFSPEFGPWSYPQWWLEEPTGTIDLRTPNCAQGCRRTLYLRAGGWSVGHELTLTIGGRTVVRLNVPDHFETFAVPVKLTGTYSSLRVAASGPGVSQASVHAGPGTTPLWIDFKSFRLRHPSFKKVVRSAVDQVDPRSRTGSAQLRSQSTR